MINQITVGCDLPYGITGCRWDCELVLDNCIGSGTTAIAAIETGRHWIGIEQVPEWAGKATERIENHVKTKT